ncbi:MAG: hypothetical protein ACE5GK_04015 [Nitrospiria bacterium]
MENRKKHRRAAASLPFAWVLSLILIGFFHRSFAQTSTDKTTMEDVRKEVHDLIEVLKGYTAEERKEAIEKTESALDRLDNRIDALESHIENRWDQMSREARREARTQLKALRKQRLRLAEWLGRLKSSSADAWEHVKKGFSDAYDTMHEAWRKAMEAFDAAH